MCAESTALHAQRAAIQHAIITEADSALHADDFLAQLDAHERAVRLSAAVGDICTDIYMNGGLDLDAGLLRVAAEATLWLESRERERAAA